MQPTYSADAEAYREKIRAWLAEHLPADWGGIDALPADQRDGWLEEWRATLADAGLLAVAWPTDYGGAGLSAIEQVVLAEELARANVPAGSGNDNFGFGMIGPTLMVRGTEEQKQHFLPRIISGEDRWCQGYSEPDAGSDLANLGCRAVLDGDEWLIDGQKIWTSGAQTANWIFVLARTDPSAAKHRGITFLLVPMDQPGIEVRPIREMTGEAMFNEVFFDGARTPAEHVVGEVNGGWAVANTLLGFERGGRASVLSIGYRAELDRIVELARERGATSDPRVRQRLAEAHSTVELLRFLGMRTLTARLAGGNPGPESSIMKLLWSHYHHWVTEFAMDLLGAEATAPAGEATGISIAPARGVGPLDAATAAHVFLGARPGTVYAGSSEVQRNIVGERILGLPKEPRSDEGPWSERG
ncbi:MAG: acyl-CoA dehydrogenase family protein [Actinomycetota bacterium]